VAGAVVEVAADEAEDRTFQKQRGCELGELRLPVLGLRRLFVVDQAPHLLEDLLADHAGQKAAENAYG
jgi:hypothetical protein